MLKVNLPHYTIDGKTILETLSFTLHKSQNLTVLGSNGAGKSTLAKILCGLYKTQKAVQLDGAYIETIPPRERSALINYIPPKLQIYEQYITVEAFLGLSRFRGTKRETYLHEVLDSLGLSAFAKNYCTQLSSGEQQLLLIASALMHGAKTTIFDEPTANLDPRKIKTVYDILQSERLSQKIVITHDLQLAYRLGYPILYIKAGRGKLYETAEMFFDTQNLEKIFDGSVKKACDAIVVQL